MSEWVIRFAVVGFMFLPLWVHARDGARVEVVQSPGWIDRSGRSEPLAPGALLAPGDQLRTGAGGRVRVRLGDGSVVKLGEEARFAIDRLGSDRAPVFTAALDVLKGAFRFTTAAAARVGLRRDISVRVRTITAGIRGTDIWGASSEEQDFVCLLEGRISVGHEDGTVATLSEPRQFFGAQRGAKPTIELADQERIDKVWSPQTEMQPVAGLLRASGGWQLVMASGGHVEVIDAYVQLRGAGFPAQIQSVSVAGERVYQAVLRFMDARSDAEALATRLERLLGLSGRVVPVR
ncbi:MAG: hypothetical protein AMXMBFR6_01250 [Betaproteobacteria bacterium]